MSFPLFQHEQIISKQILNYCYRLEGTVPVVTFSLGTEEISSGRVQRLRAWHLESTSCIQTWTSPVIGHVTSGHVTSSQSLSLPICKMGVISSYLKDCEVSLGYVKCLTYGRQALSKWKIFCCLTLP